MVWAIAREDGYCVSVSLCYRATSVVIIHASSFKKTVTRGTGVRDHLWRDRGPRSFSRAGSSRHAAFSFLRVQRPYRNTVPHMRLNAFCRLPVTGTYSRLSCRESAACRVPHDRSSLFYLQPHCPCLHSSTDQCLSSGQGERRGACGSSRPRSGKLDIPHRHPLIFSRDAPVFRVRQ